MDSDGSGGIALPVDESPGFSAPTAFGPYRVLHQAGSGVLGPVFRAFDLPHDHLVAIKAFTIASGIDQVTRLVAALRDLAGRSSPHAALVLPMAAGVEGTTPFVVLPHQTGETLDLVIRRSAPATPESILPTLRQVAAAVDAAHRAGLDHGALHPRDIFVARDGQVTVLGFGISRAVAAAALPVPLRRQFSAPERTAGGWDRRADLYSLGVILHEWLTSRRPLVPGEQEGEFAPDLPPERRVHLRTMLAKAIKPNPDERFTTAADFIQVLEHASGARLTATPIHALPTEPEVDTPVAGYAAAVPVERELPLHIEASRSSVMSDLRTLEFATGADRKSPGRASWVSGVALVALGLAAALAGHLAVRALRTTDGLPRTTVSTSPSDQRPLETTEVTVEPPPPAADDVEDSDAAPKSPITDATIAAVEGHGRLLVRSEPAGALVFVDGKRLGHTPAVINALPLGVHVVQVARSGYAPRLAHVTLALDAPEQRVSFALQPGLDARTVGVGGIDIGSRPRGARVLLDGRFVGHAPLRVPQLKPGRYTVTLELAGYQPYTDHVGVTAGTLSTITPTLRALNR